MHPKLSFYNAVARDLCPFEQWWLLTMTKVTKEITREYKSCCFQFLTDIWLVWDGPQQVSLVLH